VSRVLVVDDDPNMRDLVSFRLRKAGHRVLTAESGAAALAIVEAQGTPDVAVLDVTMPGMTGLQLLPAMREAAGSETLPAVFLSGRVHEADVEAGRALDAAYLTKPFSGIALLNAVARACEDHAEAHAEGW
jgi:CheY-like chemotaxis protein